MINSPMPILRCIETSLSSSMGNYFVPAVIFRPRFVCCQPYGVPLIDASLAGYDLIRLVPLPERCEMSRDTFHQSEATIHAFRAFGASNLTSANAVAL
jgi:hypothetical protein